MKNNNFFDLKYIEFQHNCSYLKDHIEYFFKDYFTMKDNLYKLITFCLYKKLAKNVICEKRIIDKWNRIIETRLYKTFINLKFLNYIQNFIKFYKTIYNIKCVSVPIKLDIHNIQIKGYLDLIIKRKKKYIIYLFIIEEIEEKIKAYHKILPGIVALSFFNDFHEKDFDIIIYNLATNKKYKIKNVWSRVDFYINKSRSLINTRKNCEFCIFKVNCKYVEKN